MRRLGIAIAVGLVLVVAPDARAVSSTLTIDASTRLGTINRELVGVGWHDGGAPMTTVAPLKPRLVRVDASLQDVSPTKGQLHLGPLLARVAEIRAIGAEPLVILSYMPAWLGSPRAYGRDATRVAPADPAAWEALVYDVVLALATAPAPAVRFEAWNEPDIPLFWQDSPQAFADTAARSARAVARVEAETGLDLAFGGPALAVPDPVYLAAFLQPFRDPTLPLDFVSWHYYGNLPFLGPDGTEFAQTAPVQPLIGQRNPLASPSSFGPQPGLMRAWTDAALAGTGRPAPALVLDEWNLSSGGYDRRHDTHEGAAFAAGVLAELQGTELDASSFFRGNDSSTRGGEHGLVFADGTPKPAWWTFKLWQDLAPRSVEVTGTEEGLWAVASTDGHRVTLLVASFSASTPGARTLEVDVRGLRWSPSTATVRRIDADHAEASQASPLTVNGTRVTVTLPAQAVAFVELRR